MFMYNVQCVCTYIKYTYTLLLQYLLGLTPCQRPNNNNCVHMILLFNFSNCEGNYLCFIGNGDCIDGTTND